VELRSISGNILGEYEAISERLQPVNQDCLMKKKDGQKSLDTVTKVFKVLICYRKSVIVLIVIFVEEELICRVSSITNSGNA
jgi:hypothetical protein